MADTSALGAATLGIWTRAQALEVVTEGQLGWLLRTGQWQVPLRGTYADAGFELDAHQWAAAATLASGEGSVAFGRTAARVWGLPLIDDHDPATGGTERFVHEVASGGSLRTLRQSLRPGDPRRHEVRRHQRLLQSHEVLRHPGGFLVTTALRTVLDCIPLLTREAGVCLLDAALHRELFTAEQFAAEVRTLSGRPGRRALADALDLADRRAESAPETLARLLLQPVLPDLVPQVQVRDHRGELIARVDLGDTEITLALEVDGKQGHAGEQMVAKDRDRERRLAAVGWWVERCTWYDLRRRPEALVARMVARAQLRRDRAA